MDLYLSHTLTNGTITADDPRGHQPGTECEQCPSFSDWNDNHCYGCGGVLVAPASQSTNPDNRAHARCFD